MWLKEHKDQFEQEIFGPPLLNCNITPHALDAVESLIGSNMHAFTCQNRNDYRKFSDAVLGRDGRGGIGVKDVTIREYSGTNAPTVHDQRAPYDPQMVCSKWITYWCLLMSL